MRGKHGDILPAKAGDKSRKQTMTITTIKAASKSSQVLDAKQLLVQHQQSSQISVRVSQKENEAQKPGTKQRSNYEDNQADKAKNTARARGGRSTRNGTLIRPPPENLTCPSSLTHAPIGRKETGRRRDDGQAATVRYGSSLLYPRNQMDPSERSIHP